MQFIHDLLLMMMMMMMKTNLKVFVRQQEWAKQQICFKSPGWAKQGHLLKSVLSGSRRAQTTCNDGQRSYRHSKSLLMILAVFDCNQPKVQPLLSALSKAKCRPCLALAQCLPLFITIMDAADIFIILNGALMVHKILTFMSHHHHIYS